MRHCGQHSGSRTGLVEVSYCKWHVHDAGGRFTLSHLMASFNTELVQGVA